MYSHKHYIITPIISIIVVPMRNSAAAMLVVLTLLVSGTPFALAVAPADEILPAAPALEPAVGTQELTVPLAFGEPLWADEGDYIRIEMEGTTGQLLKPDAPVLPFFTEMLTLPLGSEVIDIALRDPVYEEHIITRVIMPAPRPVPVIDGIDIPPLTEGPEYSENALFPAMETGHLLTTGSGDFGGIDAHLFASVYPLRYNPVSGFVRELRSAELVVKFVPGTVQLSDMRTSRNANESYDILVLTPPQFQNEMARYESAKEAIGYAVKIVNLTEVYNNVIFNTSTGRDQPEKIKLFIKHALENWTIRFVTIAGDTDVFPFRTAYIADSDGTNTPSDYYYGDIYAQGTLNFSSWDLDKDNLFAESYYSTPNADNADLDPDVSVGRYPASTLAELSAMLNKSFSYAENITNGSWFHNVTLVGTDTFPPSYPDSSGIAEGEYACDKASGWLSTEFNLSKFYEMKYTFSPNAIRDRINQGCGIMTFADHGNVGGVCYAQRTGAGVGLVSGTAAALTNGHMLPLSILDACLTHAIDSSESLGEYLVLNPNGGSINSIGCTRIGYGSLGVWHVESVSGYMHVHLLEMFSKGDIMPGQMLDMTKRSYLGYSGIYGFWDTKTLVEYICLGDPVTHIGGAAIKAAALNDTIWVDPGQTAFFKVDIDNPALHADDLKITLSNGKWNANLWTETMHLATNSSGCITVPVNVPADALAYDSDITMLTILPRSTGLPIKVNLTTKVNCIRKMELFVEQTVFTGRPGDPITLNFSLDNGGNIAENATVSITGGRGGWVPPSHGASTPVGPGSAVGSSMRLDIPSNCSAGTYYFQMEMKTESGLTDFALITVKVERTSGLDVIALKTSDYLGQGGASFELGLENIGNHEQFASLSLNGVPKGWGSFCPSELALQAFANTTLKLSVWADRSVLAGEYQLKLLVSPEGLAQTTVNLTAIVNRSSSLDLWCTDTFKSVSEGSDASFNIEIESRSNFEERIALDVNGLPQNWSWFSGPDVLKAPPFVTLKAQLTFQVPAPCPAGRYTITVSAIAGGWREPVSLTVDVKERHSFELGSEKLQETAISGLAAYFNLTIKNTGNCRDSYIIGIKGPMAATLSVNALELEPLSEATIELNVTAPVRSGNYELVLSVVSGRASDVQKALTFGLRVEKISMLILEYDSDSTVARGASGSFTIRVTNLGSEEDNLTLIAERLLPWNVTFSDIFVPAGAARELKVTFRVPASAEPGGYVIALKAASEFNNWDVNHKVNVPAPPVTPKTPVKQNTQSESGTLLTALLAIVVWAGIVAAVIAARRKKE